jgi:hypothetical protein
MKKLLLLGILCFVCCLTGVNIVNAQIQTPQPSPAAFVKQRIGLTDVSISYSRPSARGRKVFGEIRQYKAIWRTGANATTKITLSDDVTINGTKVPKGKYAILSIPDMEEWIVILNKDTNTTENDYKEANDVARFRVKPAQTATPYETFTIDFSNLTKTGADLNIIWETTRVSLKLVTDADSKVMAQIKEKVIDAKEVKPQDYYTAAVYYLDNDKELKKAMTWMNKGTEKDPQFWQLYQKARLQAKLKDVKGAKATANKSLELAKAAKNNDYVQMNEKFLAELSKSK